MNIIEVFEKFPDQRSCIEYLESIRWHDGIYCPYCGDTNINSFKNELRHHCNGCRKSFSVTINTIFHDTRLPLQKWFLAIALILNAKKGISAKQLQRDLNVTYKTAWSMGHRIRNAMKDDNEALLSGIVEMDETYVGGKPRKGNRKDDDGNPTNKRGRGTKKTPVVGMAQRKGKVKAKVSDKDKLKFKDLSDLVRKNIGLAGTTLVTDEYRGYIPMGGVLTHISINHQICYADGEWHTNTIEGFWSLLKRGIIGQYHKVSVKYLQSYVDEFVFKYNHRNEDCDKVFDKLLNRMM